jgi:hypothetical protein
MVDPLPGLGNPVGSALRETLGIPGIPTPGQWHGIGMLRAALGSNELEMARMSRNRPESAQKLWMRRPY